MPREGLCARTLVALGLGMGMVVTLAGMDADARGSEAESLATQARLASLPGVGNRGVRAIADAQVAVVGAGGLGCPALLGLAAAGVGQLTIIDDDRVEASNLGRQTLFRTSDIGELKVVAATRALAGFDVEVRAHPLRLDVDNAVELLRGADVVIDGTDDAATRFAVADACEALGVPLVWGSVLGFDGLATVFAPGGPRIDDLLDRAPLLAGPAADCGVSGVWSPLCAQVGAVLVSNALQLVTGVGSPLVGRVLSVDARMSRVREIPLVGQAGGLVATTSPVLHAAEHAEPPHTAPEPAAAHPPLIIDVHPGHASAADPHTIHIPLEELADRLDEVEAALGDASRPLHTRCTNGPRARAAAALLREAGWPQAHVMPDPREGA